MSATATALGGCIVTESEVIDSDGDGVNDANDYAPRDPEVQSKSDITGTEPPAGGDGATPTETAEGDTATPAEATDEGTPSATETETSTRSAGQRLVSGTGSSPRGAFSVIGPGVVRASQEFQIIGGVVEADTEQYGAFEVYINGESVRDVGLQEGQAALFARTYRFSETGTYHFEVEVRFVNGDRGIDERVGRTDFGVEVRDSGTTRVPRNAAVSGTSDRGRFRANAPSVVPAGVPFPIAGTVTEAATEQFGAFEVYIDGEAIRDVGLQEGQTARFGRMYTVSSAGTRRFVVEVRFVNGDYEVDERVGRSSVEVTVL